MPAKFVNSKPFAAATALAGFPAATDLACFPAVLFSATSAFSAAFVLTALVSDGAFAAPDSSNKTSAEMPDANANLIRQLDSEKFQELKSARSLPASVQSSYKSSSHLDSIEKVFADAGENWQSGCVRETNGPPSKSFLLAASSKKLCLVYFESGGFVLADTIDIFSLSDSGAKRVWSSSMFAEKPKDITSLIKAARQRLKKPL